MFFFLEKYSFNDASKTFENVKVLDNCRNGEKKQLISSIAWLWASSLVVVDTCNGVNADAAARSNFAFQNKKLTAQWRKRVTSYQNMIICFAYNTYHLD